MTSGYSTPSLRRQISSMSTDSESGKDPVKVYCRLKPLEDSADSDSIKLLSTRVLSLKTPVDSKNVRKEAQYKFEHIFTSYSSQKEIFDHVAYPLLTDLVNGKSSLLFTYGITGSGKTYTLTGEENNPGIMPRCIHTLFNTIMNQQTPKFMIKSDCMNGFEIQSEVDAQENRIKEARQASRTPRSTRKNGRISYINEGTKITDIDENSQFAVFVSYTEIYNNLVYDLLDDTAGKGFQGKIIREDAHKRMYVNGAVEIEVKSAEEAFQLFNVGQSRKKMAATVLNAESSRSHSIFNIRVVQMERYDSIPENNFLKISQLSLVDLAGSERTNRTLASGTRLKEAGNINNSLMSLRTCLEVLRENQKNKTKNVVPYRESRLTLLFKNFFEGEGSVQMIVCVNPSNADFDENLHVLKFAEMTQDVKIIPCEVRYTPIHKRTPKVMKTKTPKVKKFIPSNLPNVQCVKLDVEDIESTLISVEKLAKILKMRQKNSNALEAEINEKASEFRKRLVELDNNLMFTKSELQSVKILFNKEKHRTSNLQTKINHLESSNESLVSKLKASEKQITLLQDVIDDKDLKINQQYLDKQKTKQRFALANEKMAQELDAKLKRQQEYSLAQRKIANEKLKKVKQIIESELPAEAFDENSKTQQAQTQTIQKADVPVLSENKISRVPSGTPRHRRSRSIGEIWLEHNAVKPVPLGTVLQPSMKKRKSVSKLTKASDVTNSKQSKYCLIAQEPDTDGELETKLYKADIVPTCGGGAQVIFNDVERLKQESPTK